MEMIRVGDPRLGNRIQAVPCAQKRGNDHPTEGLWILCTPPVNGWIHWIWTAQGSVALGRIACTYPAQTVPNPSLENLQTRFLNV